MKYTCLKCHHVWESRVEKPAACPKCKSYSWDREKTKPGYRPAKEGEK